MKTFLTEGGIYVMLIFKLDELKERILNIVDISCKMKP